MENLVSFTVRCGLGWPRHPVGNGFLSLVAKPKSAGGWEGGEIQKSDQLKAIAFSFVKQNNKPGEGRRKSVS